jgi:hypothetical protein
MKVDIGPYKNWIGPYQIAEWLKVFGLSDDRCFAIGEKLADTWLNSLCTWIQSFRTQKIKVKIHAYDTWSMDHTLAHLIHPMLIQLQRTKHGAPLVEDLDVPEAIRSTSAPTKENEWDVDAFHFKRWDWVLDEMIWAFEQLLNDDSESKFYDHSQVDETVGIREQVSAMKVDIESLRAFQLRKATAFTLFGKYFQSLWD